MLITLLCVLATTFSALVASQSVELAGKVGPTSTLAKKLARSKCDITKHGAVSDGKTDISTALTSAFNACKTGGVVVIPSGNYALSNWVTLSGGASWALQLDGIVFRTGIEHTSDFELFSSTGKGAIQGYGYKFHQQGSISGPRILRFYKVTNFSVHDIALVDSPAFHFSMDTCDRGEVYNLAIRGGIHGGLDGIDVWSTNIWIHDIMVTNKDECVTVKSPSKSKFLIASHEPTTTKDNVLVEQIYCNWSGGCALGSLGADTNVSFITYRNIYTGTSNEMLMIKSNGGSGTVSNVVLENFIGHGNAYSLDIDQYWSSMSTAPGHGVQLNNITISNWTGTEANGKQRGPIRIICADGTPCTGINIHDFDMWTESGNSQLYSCRSAYTDSSASPYCLRSDKKDTAYNLSTMTVTATPKGYAAPTMSADLASPTWGFTASIPIPTIPSSFFPGTSPLKALAGAK
ncbi:hypothetical protein LTR62_008492 [Meristemomyces frigidus]|uniref:Rhamnogalacturonase A n=1 Tax=Meristemomyces frigidus TaxID=1508187 RepID=A0AAN7TP44_9PEZI|nr:hypothetical protein LTR62_008492 [Meristemomyces frigidus]